MVEVDALKPVPLAADPETRAKQYAAILERLQLLLEGAIGIKNYEILICQPTLEEVGVWHVVVVGMSRCTPERGGLQALPVHGWVLGRGIGGKGAIPRRGPDCPGV